MGLLSMCLPRRKTGCDGLAGGGPCGFGEAAGAELGQDMLNRPLIMLACSTTVRASRTFDFIKLTNGSAGSV